MTDLHAGARAETRARLADHIKQTAAAALVDPGKEPALRMMILGHLLDPGAKVVEAAITRWERGERFPTLDRERIADYITRALERSVLGMSASPLDLAEIAENRSPFAWSDRFAAACVQSGITEVRRARGREIGTDLHAIAETVPMAPLSTLDWTDRTLSAEDLFLQRERRGVVAGLTEIVETWDERGLTAAERNVERAQAARTLIGVPAAAVCDDAHKRWLAAFLKTPGAPEALRMSLVAHRDLASGEPQWEQLSVDDRLLDLWMDYTAEEAITLLAAPADAVLYIAGEAAAFPARPRESKRVAVRRLLKNLTVYKGWPTLVMRLEKACAAEFFDSHCEGDTRAGFDFETERAEAALDWPAAAEAALTFPGRPFGPSVRTVQDVAEWMLRAYRLSAQPIAVKEAA
ncbi:MAG: hypothetical protein J0J04_07670 [Microbacterium sp.]|uniref:hypothetical protein n=1 Tax=Microbacterium sp. TaxID=51671 RepID=UPI001AC9ACAF|nr:hypothetical protein [Microbacterium sp.]MBN9214676.1 hypothetical protein [Microbacterium sp.]